MYKDGCEWGRLRRNTNDELEANCCKMRHSDVAFIKPNSNSPKDNYTNWLKSRKENFNVELTEC